MERSRSDRKGGENATLFQKLNCLPIENVFRDAEQDVEDWAGDADEDFAGRASGDFNITVPWRRRSKRVMWKPDAD
jgi:hypothetical protein